MNIVYFGSDVFLSCFDYLAEHHRILALYTYHNDEDYITEYTIARRAAKLGIPIHYEPIGAGEIRRLFQNGCGLFFVAEYDRIIDIPEDLPEFRGVNLHSSALPQGRSYYPIEAAMERGLTTTGVTLHRLAPGLDSGAILAQRVFDVTPEMDSVDVYLRCADGGREMTEEVFRDFDAAWNAAVPQTKQLPYWRRPAAELMTLHHALRRAEAAEMFRRFNSMTQVLLDGRMYYVYALSGGAAELAEPERRLAEDRWLYRVCDGNLRLIVRPIPPKEEEELR